MKVKTEPAISLVTKTQGKEALEKELGGIIAALIEKYQPQKIILFGSLVTGRTHEWSDIDLLIIKQTRTRRFHRRAQALRGIKRSVPMDVIILTPDEVKLLSDEGSLFSKE